MSKGFKISALEACKNHDRSLGPSNAAKLPMGLLPHTNNGNIFLSRECSPAVMPYAVSPGTWHCTRGQGIVLFTEKAFLPFSCPGVPGSWGQEGRLRLDEPK